MDQKDIQLDISITFDACTKGELITPTDTCFECGSDDTKAIQEGNASFLIGLFHEKTNNSCQPCTSRMICKGGDMVGPQEGYWRISAESTEFLPCPNSDACAGTPNEKQTFTYTGNCSDGYKGNLCAACDGFAFRDSEFECLDCQSTGFSIFRLLLTLLLFLAMVGFVVRSTLINCVNGKGLHSVYLRIFINHMQVLGLISRLDIKWDVPVNYVTSAISSVSNVQAATFSYDCVVQDAFPDTPLYFAKLILVATTPLILIIPTVIALNIYVLFRPDGVKLLRDIKVAMIVILFLVHPEQSRFLLASLSCRDLGDGDTYLVEDPDIVCWRGTHLKFVLFVTVPAMVVWTFGVPMLGMYRVWKHRKELDDRAVREKLGFLYNGYENRTWYWEMVVLLRKMVLVALSLSYSGVSVSMLVLLGFLVLIVSFHFQFKYEPYLDDEADTMEHRSLLVASVTLFFGLFFLADSVHKTVDWLVFFVILIVNLYFLTYFIKEMYVAIKNSLRDKNPKLYMKICLFSRKSKEEYMAATRERANSASKIEKERSATVGGGDFQLSEVVALKENRTGTHTDSKEDELPDISEEEDEILQVGSINVVEKQEKKVEFKRKNFLGFFMVEENGKTSNKTEDPHNV